MKDQCFITTLMFLLAAPLCRSATVSVVRQGPGTGIIAATRLEGLLNSGGYYIGIGTISNAALNKEFYQLFVGFKEFAKNTSPVSGAVAGTITGSFHGTGQSTTTTPSDFNAEELFILVGNKSTRETSYEFAILKGTPSWNFVGDVSLGAASSTVVLGDLNDFSVLWGAKIDNASGPDGILLGVPEVNVSLLSMLGCVVISIKRCRRGWL